LARKYYKYLWSKAVNRQLSEYRRFLFNVSGIESIFNISFFIELVIAIIQPLPFFEYQFTMKAGYPYIDFDFTLSEFLYALMFLKLYIIFRYIVSSSIYTNPDAQYLWYYIYS